MTVEPQVLSQISKALGRSREASQAAERWLAANYLNRLAGEQDAGLQLKGKVSHITSSGFTVKLDDTGLEGLVDLRKDDEKFSFDKWTASLTSTTRRFQLGQSVEVAFVGARPEESYVAQFDLVAGCGLKSPKTEPAAAD
jgi:ribonuclease R